MASTLQLAVFALLVTVTLASPVSNISRAAVSSSCTSPGIFCMGCNKLAFCVETNGKFLEYTIEDCGPETPCSASLKECSDKNSFCKDATLNALECVEEGIFPDPYDCNVYHDCGDDTSPEYAPRNTYTCKMDFAFNPKTGLCDLPATDALCGEGSYPVPKCDSSVAFAVGALALDPQYYWICVRGRIHMLKCREGTIFTEMGCFPEGEEPAEEPSEESEEPPSGVFPCSGTGKEPDPQSCTRYYDCSDPKQPIRFACPWAQYFHPRKNRCVLGFCSH